MSDIQGDMMPKLDMFAIGSTLDTDKLNSNFRAVTYDINTLKRYLTHLGDLYTTQLTNVAIINKWRAAVYAYQLALESANTEFTESGIGVRYIDVNTAAEVTHDNTVANYGNVMLDTTHVFERFPKTTNHYGDIVPLYNSIVAKRNGTVITDETDPLYWAIAQDTRRTFIEEDESGGSPTDIEYTIESILSSPMINSIVIEPVFAGLCNIDVEYGFSDTWELIRSYTGAFPTEIIFKQSIPNATGIRLTSSFCSLDGSSYAGFYKIGASYKTFYDSGTVIFKYTIGAGAEIRKFKLNYEFNDLTQNNPLIVSRIFNIKMYDGSLSTDPIYDSGTDAFPLTTSDEAITIANNDIYIAVTMSKYHDISPVIKGLILGVTI